MSNLRLAVDLGFSLYHEGNLSAFPARGVALHVLLVGPVQKDNQSIENFLNISVHVQEQGSACQLNPQLVLD